MNGNGTGKSTSQPGAKMIDDFLRRELRVGDPKNPTEVVTALRRRYATEAARIDQEAKGLPIRYEATPQVIDVTPSRVDGPGSREERRVRDNLESDLAALIDSRDNREWAPEIRGWRETLLREYTDGSAAARFAQDPAQRDRGFLAVRKLGEFARLARLVGVMNLALNCDYRRLASTLDAAANVIRILMGEALYNAGLAEGGFIIQVPLVDLRQRRDSLVEALRRLAGLSDPSFDGDWGDDMAAYRALLDELDRRSAAELKVYLREELLTPILDNLVSTVSRQDPEALRQLAATFAVEVARLSRLREIVTNMRLGQPPAPQAAALSAFEQALQLFVTAFTHTRSGARLVDLAVPLPMAAQQPDSTDREGRRILRDLVGARGEFAIEAECFLSCCGCGVAELRCQVKVDKVLYDIDRAIDLVSQGQGHAPTWGNEEQRAAVYGIIARNLAAERGCITPELAYNAISDIARAGIALIAAAGALAEHDLAIGPNPDVRNFARAIGPWVRRLTVAADVLATGQPLSEGLLRDLLNPLEPLPVVTAALAGVPNLPDYVNRLNRLITGLTSAPATPGGIQSALSIILDTAELVSGASGIAAPGIAGVVPGAGAVLPENMGVGVGLILATGVGGLPPVLNDALAAINAAQQALHNALVAIGNQIQANLDAAGVSSALARDAAETAHNTAYPPTGIAPPPGLQQRALTEAEDAARAAMDVSGTVARFPVLPAGRQGEPTGLWRALDNIVRVLLRDNLLLPGNVVDQGLLMREVFEDQFRGEQDWLDLIASLAPRCLGPGRRDLVLAGRDLLYGNPTILSARPFPATNPQAPTIRGSLAAIAARLAATPTPAPAPPPVPAAPLLTALTPNSASAGSPSFTLTVTGSNFVSGASVRWNGAPRPTTFVSATQLDVTIPAGDIANFGMALVTASNPGGALSSPLPFSINPAPPTAPILMSLSPNTAFAGDPGFTLMVGGSGFVRNTSVQWNGVARTTAFVSATQLAVTIPASDIASPGTATVTATIPATAPLNALPFAIVAPPVPQLTSLSPDRATAGDPGFVLTVTGSGFARSAQVLWNGANRSTTFVSATRIEARIDATDVATAGTAQVTATNAGSAASNALRFTIDAPPPPTVTSIAPNVGSQGDRIDVTVKGAGFVSGATLDVGAGIGVSGVTMVSAIELTATLTIAATAAVGPRDVSVTNPGGFRGTLSGGFTVTAAPTVTSIAPAVGSQGDTVDVTVEGTGFVSGATLDVGAGIAVSGVTVGSATELTATLTIDPAAAVGPRAVTVANPGGSSATLIGGFTVTAAPTVTSIDPDEGSRGTIIDVTVEGTGFVSGATLDVGAGITVSGVTVGSATELAATLTIAATATLGPRDVTVTNPGGSSGTLSAGFTVTAAPTVISIDPDEGSRGTTINVTVEGTGFVSGAMLDVGAGITVSGPTVVYATELTATLTIAATATVGPRDVTVTNPDGSSGTLSEGFTVTDALSVQDIDPHQGSRGHATTVTVEGTGFVSGATLSVGSGITVSDPVVQSATELTATLTVAATAMAGPRDVRVTNPDGSSDTLSHGFHIIGWQHRDELLILLCSASTLLRHVISQLEARSIIADSAVNQWNREVSRLHEDGYPIPTTCGHRHRTGVGPGWRNISTAVENWNRPIRNMVDRLLSAVPPTSSEAGAASHLREKMDLLNALEALVQVLP